MNQLRELKCPCTKPDCKGHPKGATTCGKLLGKARGTAYAVELYCRHCKTWYWFTSSGKYEEILTVKH